MYVCTSLCRLRWPRTSFPGFCPVMEVRRSSQATRWLGTTKVTWNHLWHQARKCTGAIPHPYVEDEVIKQYEPRHKFRCLNCYEQHRPWVQRDHLAKFNMVLFTSIVPDPDALECVSVEDGGHPSYQLVPCWWTDDTEKKYINMLKEFAAGVPKGNYKNVDYKSIAKRIEELTDTFRTDVPCFEMHAVPDKNKVVCASLNKCNGYEHCDENPQVVSGFFFPRHLEVGNKEIFTSWKELIDELNLSLGLVEPEPEPQEPAPSPHMGPEGCWMSPASDDDGEEEPDAGDGWCYAGSMECDAGSMEDDTAPSSTYEPSPEPSFLAVLGGLNPLRGIIPWRTTSTSASSTDRV